MFSDTFFSFLGLTLPLCCWHSLDFATWLQLTSLLKSEAKRHQILPPVLASSVSVFLSPLSNRLRLPFVGILEWFYLVGGFFSLLRNFVILVILLSYVHCHFVFCGFWSYVFMLFFCIWPCNWAYFSPPACFSTCSSEKCSSCDRNRFVFLAFSLLPQFWSKLLLCCYYSSVSLFLWACH